MKCYNPITIYKNLDRKEFPRGIEVDCGKCIICKQKRALNKAIRMLNEAETKLENNNKYKINFLTFTYDDEHIYKKNGIPTLCKKMIRKIRDKIYSRMYRKYKKTGNRKYIEYKYMIAGEYGQNGTERPHYHMIIITKGKNAKIIHEWIKELKGGRTDVQTNATTRSIFYVAGYVAKKIGEKATKKEIEDPFIICSKGLGKEWVLQNSELLKEREYLEIPTNKGIIKTRIPRIYIDWLQRNKKWTDEEVEDYKKRMREKAEEDNRKLIFEVINEEHYKITGRLFIEEDEIFKKTDRIFEEYDGITNIYKNWIDKNGLWHNSLWEHYKTGINRIRKLRAIQKLEEKEARKRKKYIEYGDDKIC